MSTALQTMLKFYETFDVSMEKDDIDTCTSCYLSLKKEGKLSYLKNLKYFDQNHTKQLFLNIIHTEIETEKKNEVVPDEKTEQIISEVCGFITGAYVGTQTGTPDMLDSFCTNFRFLQEKGYLFYITAVFYVLEDEIHNEEVSYLSRELVERELA